MPAVKLGAAINVTGSPNTLSSITSDINDVTWIEEAPAGTFTVKAKHLVAQNGGVITIGDSGDFSVVEKLVMEPSGNTNCRLDIDKGGEVQLFGASEIDANLQAPSFYQRWRWYGKFYCRGNATYRPYIYNLYLIWKFRTSFSGDGFDRNHDVMDIDYLRVDTPWSAAGKWTQPSIGRVFADYGVEKIKNAIFGKNGDPAWKCVEVTQAQARHCGDDASKIIWEDCIFQYMGNCFYLAPYHYYFKNCQFLQSTSHALGIYQPFTVPGIARTENALYRDMTIQLYVFLDGCTFTPVYTQDVLAQWGGAVLAKDCTFNASDRAFNVVDGGKVLIWTGNTFNGTYAAYRTNANSMVFYVHALDLTIQDKGGSPIEGAMIYVKQKDGKEAWTFKTDANGKPINMAALQGKIILVHKEQLDNVPNFTLWSDAGNSTYHDVWIYAAGYEPATVRLVMSQDRNETIQLENALTAPDVRENEDFGLGLIGELDLPDEGDVEKGVQFDSTTKTGTFKPPIENNVRKNVQYGKDDVEFTGKAVVPAKADVRENVDVDVSDKGEIDLPDVGDVEKGVQFDSLTKTGTFKVPLEEKVEKKYKYGKDDVEFTGELVAMNARIPIVGTLQPQVSITGKLRKAV